MPTRSSPALGARSACNRERPAVLNGERDILCPYCGEKFDIVLDLSVPAQEYFEDCFVCCRPILIRYRAQFGEVTELVVRAENEA